MLMNECVRRGRININDYLSKSKNFSQPLFGKQRSCCSYLNRGQYFGLTYVFLLVANMVTSLKYLKKYIYIWQGRGSNFIINIFGLVGFFFTYVLVRQVFMNDLQVFLFLASSSLTFHLHYTSLHLFVDLPLAKLPLT